MSNGKAKERAQHAVPLREKCGEKATAEANKKRKSRRDAGAMKEH
jgi:hypothetical protein